ncbi:unnamed protein product [Nezara viridula]|uniref:Uncharacterized protein n=1 Tax=Nezara viridula TaxID=85310 RepID=A0A9P0H6H9_NEZVI|nr:unnamed protein product [Nezara viridula]
MRILELTIRGAGEAVGTQSILSIQEAEMKYTILLLFLAFFVGAVLGMPTWFDQLFNLNGRRREAAPRQSRDYYKTSCRIINPDPYAFPGRAPYPAQPFCPY